MPVVRAEIERGFFLRAIEFLQSGEYFGGCDGYERSAVAERNRPEAELHAYRDPEHEEGESGDDAWKNEGQKHKAPEQRFAGERNAIECERRRCADDQSDKDGAGGHDQAVQDGVPHSGIGKQFAIPTEREPGRREPTNGRAVKGIENQNGDRQIKERKYQKHVQL